LEPSTGSTTEDETFLCGDQQLDPGEGCDDGNIIAGDGCEPDCTVSASFCGDQKIELGEQCDDGNVNNTDDCVSCAQAMCGDGYLHAGVEQCDDGSNNGSYGACALDCQGPDRRCGDSELNGPEDCDDGNLIDEDDCSNDCVAPRIVFVTSYTSGGNWGGLGGADEVCSAAAGGEIGWRAWLSDSQVAAAERLDQSFTGYYKRSDGVIVAHGWSDLTDGALTNPINLTEKGEMLPYGQAIWTNTNAAGERAGDSDCMDWTYDGDQAPLGVPAVVGATDSTWTENGTAGCSNLYRLYCFEDRATSG